MITFTLRVDGVTRTLARFQRLETRLADFRPLWSEMIAVFQDIAARAFDTQGGSTAAGPWVALRPGTIKERERQGFGATPILQREGTLRRAVTLPRVSDNSPSRLELTIDSDIYPYHQSSQPRFKIPRRAMVAFTSADRARFRETALAYVNRTIAADNAAPGDFA